MSVFKCKMCGGALEVNNESVATCEYCGTKQTLPKLDDERKANLYDRANHFRRNNEFDKAMGIYEQILNEDNTDAEAYWSLVLCRYGIEYVEDPSSRKRIPTVNRAQFTSVFDDEDFKAALKYADGSQKNVYEQEALAINEIQKGILAISQKEEPFDVFICYKETDNNGRRTPDSVLANDLYHQLTQEGFKVFFARITLEDKLGSAYEPYIFAALNSAKVMVVLGTKPEFFNAVWVKNEWSRYLALIKQGQKKMLIPAYKDMDPYDLPEEFSHLQAQDMSKLGFMQDLIRGIKKIAQTDEPTAVVKETVISSEPLAANLTALLDRGYMALEDGEWEKADDFFEQALNQNAKLPEAYIGKLMAELKVHTRDALKDCAEPFDSSTNFQKAVRFADEKTKEELNGYIETCRQRIKELEAEEKERERQEEFARQQEQKNIKKIAAILSSVLAVVLVATFVLTSFKSKPYKDTISISEDIISISEDIISISAGYCHTVGLKSDGTVVAIGGNGYGQCDVSGWKDIISVSAGDSHTVGLKSDGTVVAAGDNDDGQCDVSEWKDIISVSAGYRHTVGLKSDGTVVAAGYNGFGRCDVSGWKDIISVSAGYDHTVGLKSDGTVVATGYNYDGQCDVSEWKDIISVSAGEYHTVGLKSDGTVVAAGSNSHGRCDVSEWKDIISVSAGYYHTVGLKSDGTVVAAGDNDDGQCDVSEWKDIISISAGDYHTVGLKSDGTVVAAGYNRYGQCDVGVWKG